MRGVVGLAYICLPEKFAMDEMYAILIIGEATAQTDTSVDTETQDKYTDNTDTNPINISQC